MSATASTALVAGAEVPEHEAVRLLMAASGLSRAAIVVGTPIDTDTAEAFAAMVERRRGGEPLQYIEGDVPFGPVVVSVDPRTLIPRPETEELLERVLAIAGRPSIIVDLCTGSGNLAIALARSFPDAEVFATDVSPDAVDVARANALRNGADVTVLAGDLFSPLPERLRGAIDLLVANPPYVADAEWAELPDDVRREPRVALVAGPCGDEVLARIAAGVHAWLAPGGTVACEIAASQGARMVELFADVAGVVERDLAGRDRFVVGVRGVE